MTGLALSCGVVFAAIMGVVWTLRFVRGVYHGVCNAIVETIVERCAEEIAERAAEKMAAKPGSKVVPFRRVP